MEFVTDLIIDSFFEYYRLGKHALKPEQALYFSLQLEKQQAYHEGRKQHDHFIKEVLNNHENTATHSTKGIAGVEVSFESLSGRVQDRSDTIRIIVISDTHERESALGILPPCDILIHSGDILMSSRVISPARARQKYQQFNQWLGSQPATHKIVIGGNHDCILDGMPKEEADGLFSNGTYLCNSGMEVMGLYIWGSPASLGRSGNQAFQSKAFNEQAAEALHTLNDSKQAIDILVTHGTCTSLQHIAQPRLMHVSGHYHAHHGVYLNAHTNEKASANPSKLLSVCAPIMDHKYRPHNMAIVLDVK